MSSIKSPFLKGFIKTAGWPKWLHNSHSQIQASRPAGQSKKGLKGMLKRRGVLMGAIGG